MSGETSNPYDSAPYPMLAYGDAHPARMAAIATLLDLPVAPVDTARVLEIGCAVGGQLLPMAMSLPRATFTGIDLAGEQVAQARTFASDLGLTNVQFLQADIRDFAPEPDSFDFIMAHGIYSWVAPETRDALLALVARALAPGGVGYVSYNTLPGWHGLMAVRRVLELGAGSIEDPVERAKAGLDTLQFMRTLLPDDSTIRPFLEWYDRAEGNRFRMVGVNHLVLVTHDELSEYNDPIYFLDFVAHARRHGLHHIADADFSTSFPHGLPAEQVAGINERVSSPEEFEQYLDFIHDRTFRRSLLVKGDGPVRRKLRAQPETVRGFRIRARSAIEGETVLAAGHPMAFVAPDGARLRTDHPFSKAALVEAIEAAPESIAYPDLVQRATRRLGAPTTSEDEVLLAANLLSAFTYSAELLDLRAADTRIATTIAERPTVDPYVRWMAGRRETLLTNRFFDRVPVKPVMAIVLALLDGTRTLDEAAAAAEEFLEAAGGATTTLQEAVREVADFARATGLLVPAANDSPAAAAGSL